MRVHSGRKSRITRILKGKTCRKEEYKWKIEDIFPSPEAWEQEKERLKKMIDNFDDKYKEWTISSQRMLAFCQYIAGMEKISFRLLDYASLQNHMEMGNPLYRRMLGDIWALYQTFVSKQSPIEKDIINPGREKFNRYLKAEPRLQPYAQSIIEVFNKEKHLLSPAARIRRLTC